MSFLFVLVPHTPIVRCVVVQVDMHTVDWCYSWRTPSFQNSSPLKCKHTCLTIYFPRGKHCLYYIRHRSNLPVLRAPISSSAHNMRDPWRIFSQFSSANSWLLSSYIKEGLILQILKKQSAKNRRIIHCFGVFLR